LNHTKTLNYLHFDNENIQDKAQSLKKEQLYNQLKKVKTRKSIRMRELDFSQIKEDSNLYSNIDKEQVENKENDFVKNKLVDNKHTTLNNQNQLNFNKPMLSKGEKKFSMLKAKLIQLSRKRIVSADPVEYYKVK